MNLRSNTLNGWCTCGFFSGSGEFDNSSSTVRTGLLFFFFWLDGWDFCLGFEGVGDCYYFFVVVNFVGFC